MGAWEGTWNGYEMALAPAGETVNGGLRGGEVSFNVSLDHVWTA